MPAKVVGPSSSVGQFLRIWLGPLLAPLGTLAVIVVFVIFMLLQRKELRDRLIRLTGTGHLSMTTQALDAAGHHYC